MEKQMSSDFRLTSGQVMRADRAELRREARGRCDFAAAARTQLRFKGGAPGFGCASTLSAPKLVFNAGARRNA